jgi:hypothetical protein
MAWIYHSLYQVLTGTSRRLYIHTFLTFLPVVFDGVFFDILEVLGSTCLTDCLEQDSRPFAIVDDLELDFIGVRQVENKNYY